MTTDDWAGLAVGTPVVKQMRKWGGGAHWRADTRVLGTDDHGLWLGVPAGATVARPGHHFVSPAPTATLVPWRDHFVANFNAPPSRIPIYIDIATPAELVHDTDGYRIESVDLDLDVVVRDDEPRTWIDDEDEFAEHQVALGYPVEVIAAAREAADRLLAEVRDGAEPFRAVAAGWLARV